MGDVRERVERITAKTLDVESTMVKQSSNFSLDLGADSLDATELVMDFEDEFGIEISDFEMDSITTVKEAVDLINEKLMREADMITAEDRAIIEERKNA